MPSIFLMPLSIHVFYANPMFSYWAGLSNLKSNVDLRQHILLFNPTKFYLILANWIIFESFTFILFSWDVVYVYLMLITIRDDIMHYIFKRMQTFIINFLLCLIAWNDCWFWICIIYYMKVTKWTQNTCLCKSWKIYEHQSRKICFSSLEEDC